MDAKNDGHTETDTKKVCAFLDLLGFRYFLGTDVEGSFGLLGDYQTILYTSILNRKIQASRPPRKGILRKLGEEIGTDSFDYFVPFSDSIFMESSDPNLFVAQLSHFLLRTFLFKARAFDSPENEEDITMVTIKEIGTNTSRSAHWFPAIFRGGIAYDECHRVSLNSIIDGSEVSTISLVGKAVVEAVRLESSLNIKGPRMLCSPAFHKVLVRRVQKYTIRVEEDGRAYEILWPAYAFVSGNPVDTELINHFDEMFRPAVRLWRQYNHLESNLHYFNFIKLIVKGTLRHFSYDPRALDEARRHIVLELKREELYIKMKKTADEFH